MLGLFSSFSFPEKLVKRCRNRVLVYPTSIGHLSLYTAWASATSSWPDEIPSCTGGGGALTSQPGPDSEGAILRGLPPWTGEAREEISRVPSSADEQGLHVRQTYPLLFFSLRTWPGRKLRARLPWGGAPTPFAKPMREIDLAIDRKSGISSPDIVRTLIQPTPGYNNLPQLNA